MYTVYDLPPPLPVSTCTPTEEEPSTTGGSGEVMERNRKPIHSGGGVSAFTTLGTLVLTARPYDTATGRTGSCHSDCDSAVDVDGTTLQAEIFQTVHQKVCMWLV